MSLRLAFYGDDFTGSTDVMETLTRGGAPTVLFLDPPTAAQLRAFPNAEAVGVAGVSRSWTPEQMAVRLPEAFAMLKGLGAAFNHYKVCSTFDSSPAVGSIGKAIELGLAAFPDAWVPLVVGAPTLGRYVVFGHLFARAGNEIVRLDRHPTMRVHPSTPMQESDLRRHLGTQTALPTGLVDALTLERGPQAVRARIAQLRKKGGRVIFFDTLTDAHLLTLGEVLVGELDETFLVGSSGLEAALVRYWEQQGTAQPELYTAPVGPVERLVVVSGSAAPATAAQIETAERAGFATLRIDVPRLLDPGTEAAEHACLLERAVAALRERSVVLYSAKGPDDPALAETRRTLERLGRLPHAVSALLGAQQGALLRDLVKKAHLTRVCVAGGDTCGYAAKALGVTALELRMVVAPGAPLCLAHREAGPSLELSLKAGQVGTPDYFLAVQNGTPEGAFYDPFSNP